MNEHMPGGTVTLMFTDIEGSTTLWDTLGAATVKPILEAHNTIVRQARERYSGYEIRSEGDAFFLAFGAAIDAVQCAVEAQVALIRHSWPETIGQQHVRPG